MLICPIFRWHVIQSHLLSVTPSWGQGKQVADSEQWLTSSYPHCIDHVICCCCISPGVNGSLESQVYVQQSSWHCNSLRIDSCCFPILMCVTSEILQSIKRAWFNEFSSPSPTALAPLSSSVPHPDSIPGSRKDAVLYYFCLASRGCCAGSLPALFPLAPWEDHTLPLSHSGIGVHPDQSCWKKKKKTANFRTEMCLKRKKKSASTLYFRF